MKNNLAFASRHIAPDDTAPAPAVDQATHAAFLTDLQHGLARQQKSISPKYFYDVEGSRLFDQICALPEYYPTRTELDILKEHAHEIALRIGTHAEIIEFGAGSLHKVRVLLDAMDRPLPTHRNASNEPLHTRCTRGAAQLHICTRRNPAHRKLL